MGHNGPNNIGTHPEDVPRSLNAAMGGEGSPTDRLWMRYRTELAERPSHHSGDRAQRGGKLLSGTILRRSDSGPGCAGWGTPV